MQFEAPGDLGSIAKHSAGPTKCAVPPRRRLGRFGVAHRHHQPAPTAGRLCREILPDEGPPGGPPRPQHPSSPGKRQRVALDRPPAPPTGPCVLPSALALCPPRTRHPPTHRPLGHLTQTCATVRIPRNYQGRQTLYTSCNHSQSDQRPVSARHTAGCAADTPRPPLCGPPLCGTGPISGHPHVATLHAARPTKTKTAYNRVVLLTVDRQHMELRLTRRWFSLLHK